MGLHLETVTFKVGATTIPDLVPARASHLQKNRATRSRVLQFGSGRGQAPGSTARTLQGHQTLDAWPDSGLHRTYSSDFAPLLAPRFWVGDPEAVAHSQKKDLPSDLPRGSCKHCKAKIMESLNAPGGGGVGTIGFFRLWEPSATPCNAPLKGFYNKSSLERSKSACRAARSARFCSGAPGSIRTLHRPFVSSMVWEQFACMRQAGERANA